MEGCRYTIWRIAQDVHPGTSPASRPLRNDSRQAKDRCKDCDQGRAQVCRKDHHKGRAQGSGSQDDHSRKDCHQDHHCNTKDARLKTSHSPNDRHAKGGITAPVPERTLACEPYQDCAGEHVAGDSRRTSDRDTRDL